MKHWQQVITLSQMSTHSWRLNLNMWTCWRSKTFETCQIAFAFFLPQQRQVLVYAHSQNFFIWRVVKHNFCREIANRSAPKTVTEATKAAHERYLLCGTASWWISMYCRCKSGQKLRLNTKYWGLPKNTNKQNILYELVILGI